MIRTRIREIAQENSITTAYQLQKAANLPPSMAARLFKDKVEMIALRTIESLCNAFQCEPADLFIYEPSNAKSDIK
jgi:DNA-binding Xre family transcriptional regulator